MGAAGAGVSLNLFVTNFPNNSDNLFNDVIVKSLIVSLDLGLTYIEIAETSQYEETACRNYGNARKSYARAVDALEKIALNRKHRQSVEVKLALLQARLNISESRKASGLKSAARRRAPCPPGLATPCGLHPRIR
jgi:hypothetical protein